MEKKVKCISCNAELTNDVGSTIFKCPNCGKKEIVRCSKCRKLSVKYKCPECEFEGPN